MTKSSMQPPDDAWRHAPGGDAGDGVGFGAASDSPGVGGPGSGQPGRNEAPSPARRGDADDAADWLRLALTPGIGPASMRALLGAFGLPRAVFGRSGAALAAVVGAGPAQALLADDPDRDRAVAATLAWLDAAPARHLLTLADPRYPPRLLETADPPPLLYVTGDPAVLSRPAIAIVGSRDATAGGTDNAFAFARALADAGFAVFSGLAAGIDGAAHRGALGRGGGTAAFVGTGPDRVYPARHRDLAHAIVASGGAIASELPLGAPPLPAHFPRRNRLIAGAALGVLVVEAARDSGSLITARLAADLGREVFAIPGSIHSPLARGCHDLIRQGAKLVELAEDILSELPGRATSPRPPGTAAPARGRDARNAAAPAASRAASPPGGPATGPIAPDPASDPPTTPARGPGSAATPARAAEATAPTGSGTACAAGPCDAALAVLGWDPVAVDDLVARSADAAATWTARLVGWELDGLASRLPDGRWQRRR